MPASLPRRLSAHALPPGLRPRAAAFVLLGLAVLGLHHTALRALARWRDRPAAAPSPAVPAAPAGLWQLQPSQAVAVATQPAQRPAPAAPRAPRLPRSSAPAVVPPRPAAPSPERPDHEAPDAPPATAAAPLQEPGGGSWPVYPTRVPGPTTLRFRLERGAQTGEARWTWAWDGTQFHSHWQATLAGQPWLDQRSTGALDAAGLAPLRMLEQPRGRAPRSVNFQRDKGVLSYSGSARQWALPPGAQDRASWLPQLLAVVGAAPDWAVGTELVLPVAGPRGDLDRWTFSLLAQQPALHWRREPQRPWDVRVDVWLEPAAPHWPQALQWQLLPGGEPLRWVRQADAGSDAP